MSQPVDRIAPVRPAPSLLTSARDRTGDNFGAGPAPVPDNAEQVDGGATPSTAAWRNGISWNPTACAASHNWADCPPAAGTEEDPFAEKDPGLVGETVDVSPFWIYTLLECDWTTLASEGRLDTDAQAVLEVATAAGMARALWLADGLPADHVTLRSAAEDITPAGGTVSIEDAFALLLAEYTACTDGGGATFHVPVPLIPSILGAADGGRLAERSGNMYRGPLDSIVSPGPGYPYGSSAQGAGGFGPQVSEGVFQGSDDDEAWVYVTGTVEYALGAVEEAGDRQDRFVPRENRYQALAERQAIVRFDPCCTFAARVQSVAVGPT